MLRAATLFVVGLVGAVSGMSINTNFVPQNGNANVNVNNGGWHIHVTLHVYSGRSDPTWRIHETHPEYKRIVNNMVSLPVNDLPEKLGYKGFSLVHVPPGRLASSGGHYNQTVASFPDWEMMLLSTSNGIDDYLKDHAKQTIYENSATGGRHRRSLYDPNYRLSNYDYSSLFGTPTTVDPINSLTDEDMYKLAKLMGFDKRLLNVTTTPVPAGPTTFEPNKWNKYFIKSHNNCYNYANNRVTDTFAQPGRAGECQMTLESRGLDIEKSAKCDGLKPVPALSQTELPKHDWNLVALVFWPPKPGSMTFDFHWYRLDGNDMWSHKPGKTSATNIDSSDKHITDPRHADRGPYTQFITFMETRQDKVLLI